ncbi:outer membrane beta-barrel protein [Mucilaginibacter myungsuensis]|uniref:PorT family protein n=1 Tax=Mucilaginibacter myungsuensis TaxID=649104 RepID=A0A929KY52_9SPHI|nr:outer membrane beta-barrel protein [Mucilaginibacter myungsuensis]MBE9662608.1 PorT family protein [Mucilaginibacter myungsuensis]MDN3598028.1 outer membrane beta-barrel protein [Mucilaginibacter myungsuensis]
MKNSLKYSKLWQQKRDELKIDANPDMDWSGMQGLLDQHMPVTTQSGPTDGGSSAGSSASSGASAGASGLAKLGGIIGLSTAVVAVTVYVASHFIGSTSDKKSKDSLTRSAIEQKALMDSTKILTDTLSENYQALTDSAEMTADVDSIVTNGHTAANYNNNAENSANSKDPTSIVPANNAASSTSKNNTISKNTASRTVSVSRSGAVVNSSGRKLAASVNNKSGISKNGSGYVPNRSGRSQGRNDRSGRGAQGNNGGRNNSRMPAGGDRSSKERSPDGRVNNIDDKANTSYSSVRNDANEIATANDWYERTMQALSVNKFADAQHTIKSPGMGGWSPLTGNIRNIALQNKINQTKNQTAGEPSNFEWGILAGINTNSSFSRRLIDTNGNTSLQIDFYAGLYGTYYFKPKWGIGAQLWLYNPQKISGGYDHANGSKVDSGQLIRVTDSRKDYFVTLPIQAIYKVNDNLSVKLGPVLKFPISQTSGVTSLIPATISRDTAYFRNTMAQLNGTRLDQKMSVGISGGLQYQYGRFNIQANYLKNLSGYSVTSGYGNYKMTDPGSLHITVGVRLNRAKE